MPRSTMLKRLSAARSALPLLAGLMLSLFGGETVAMAAEAALSPGAWAVSGMPSPTGKPQVATLAKAKGEQMLLSLPNEFLPGMKAQKVLLKQTGPKAYSGALPSGGTVSLIATAPDAANLELDMKEKGGFGKFSLDLSRVGN
ncbi:hypothetical protein [Pedomonas mirosovicensis]|uniref:hypothetical protein n=1 Tax=Pedomonas mirosovicensis TaxID=2908641 RepID=UPI0021680907|nr:hypothetical protein [Pedomonas mirosovicensis]MCH8685165.1 hypothetical protein [Pedomonas mirosovicensis]